MKCNALWAVLRIWCLAIIRIYILVSLKFSWISKLRSCQVPVYIIALYILWVLFACLFWITHRERLMYTLEYNTSITLCIDVWLTWWPHFQQQSIIPSSCSRGHFEKTFKTQHSVHLSLQSTRGMLREHIQPWSTVELWYQWNNVAIHERCWRSR